MLHPIFCTISSSSSESLSGEDFGTHILRYFDHISKSCDCFRPGTCFETAIRINGNLIHFHGVNETFQFGFDKILCWHNRRMDIVKSRTKALFVTDILESTKCGIITASIFDRIDVSIHSINGFHAISKFTVTHVSMDGCLILGSSRRETECINRPRQIFFTALRTHWHCLSKGGLVNLNYLTTSLFKISDFFSECQRNLKGLFLSRNISTRKRPI
mmetsp:Transcript_200/g.224  ORF Transcript_200/g.224 Transcript_200/m.224 type:complete len:216 (+) Transcript_200:121-768(+)